MIPPAVRPDIDPTQRAGVAHPGPVLTPDKVANSLRVHRTYDLGGAVEVDFMPEHETGRSDEDPSDAVSEWLEQHDFAVSESGGRVLEHLVIPAEVLLEDEGVMAVRDCHFVVSRYEEDPDEAADQPTTR